MTPTTTAPSGQSLDESQRLAENALGEALSLLPDDPYLPICVALWRLLSRKRGYYGCKDEHPLENALGVEAEGIDPWVYQLARIGEKCRRLRGMVGRGGTIAIRETLADIAGHAVLGIALRDHAAGESINESQSC